MVRRRRARVPRLWQPCLTRIVSAALPGVSLAEKRQSGIRNWLSKRAQTPQTTHLNVTIPMNPPEEPILPWTFQESRSWSFPLLV